MDAIVIGSHVTDKVRDLHKMLAFSSTLDMVLWNHGRRRSFTSVLRKQLQPAIAAGVVYLDSKHPYHYALVAGVHFALH